MSLPILKDKLINEINLIPDDKLLDLYNVIHYFRLGVEKLKPDKKVDILSYSGSWKDMDTDIFDDFIADVSKRRNNAFSNRRGYEKISY